MFKHITIHIQRLNSALVAGQQSSDLCVPHEFLRDLSALICEMLKRSAGHGNDDEKRGGHLSCFNLVSVMLESFDAILTLMSRLCPTADKTCLEKPVAEPCRLCFARISANDGGDSSDKTRALPLVMYKLSSLVFCYSVESSDIFGARVKTVLEKIELYSSCGKMARSGMLWKENLL